MKAKEAVEYLKENLARQTDEAQVEAEIFVSHILNISRGSLKITNKTVNQDDLKGFLARRKKGEPLQYILGKWEFYKGEFYVGKGVLIPRQDTETLVEVATQFLKTKENPKVIDLCSGSGCVAISIATDCPTAEIIAAEKYKKAYKFLEKNIKHNKTNNVTPMLLDITKKPLGQYDLIVSNPPYITQKDMQTLSKEVKKEPKTALFGGEDGLYFYRVIAEKWIPCLKKGGKLAVEIGIGQDQEVIEIFKKAGLTNAEAQKDLCGVQRVVFGTADLI